MFLSKFSFVSNFTQVSWIRRDDLHVLTTELMTYTSDKRFRSAHVRGSPFWTLEINSPTVTDTGVYECQVSSIPKIHRRIHLMVTGGGISQHVTFVIINAD